MATVETTEVKRKSKSKLIIIILLVFLLTLSAIIFFLVLDDNQVSQIKQMFQSNGEYTILLDEFVVNLKSESVLKHFLKVKITLMYTDEKQGENIGSNVSKIRDIILSNLRAETYEDLLNLDNTINLKKDILNNLNIALGEDVIKDIYITDLIIQ